MRKRIRIKFIDAEEVEKNGTAVLENLDGICIP
jgi:hypothetical protein